MDNCEFNNLKSIQPTFVGSFRTPFLILPSDQSFCGSCAQSLPQPAVRSPLPASDGKIQEASLWNSETEKPTLKFLERTELRVRVHRVHNRTDPTFSPYKSNTKIWSMAHIYRCRPSPQWSPKERLFYTSSDSCIQSKSEAIAQQLNQGPCCGCLPLATLVQEKKKRLSTAVPTLQLQWQQWDGFVDVPWLLFVHLISHGRYKVRRSGGPQTTAGLSKIFVQVLLIIPSTQPLAHELYPSNWCLAHADELHLFKFSFACPRVIFQGYTEVHGRKGKCWGVAHFGTFKRS